MSADVQLILSEAGRQLTMRARVAESKLASLAQLHSPVNVEPTSEHPTHICGHDSEPWPCATASILVDVGPPVGVLLTPDEIDVVAPALLEAGTRHLEKPGIAWQQLGAYLHRIAERLYAATNRQEQPHA